MSVMEDLKRKLEEDYLKYMTTSKYMLTKAAYVAIGFFVLIFIFISIFSLFISRRIIRPLNMLKEGVAKISKGNLKHKIPAIKTGDEIEDLANAFNKMVDDLNKYIQTLTETVRAKERVEADIKFAASIQREILPGNLEYTAESQKSKVAISSILQPAKTIAGDFYDYLFIDDKHLFFIIGDVSGKGAPASFFMAIIKTYIKDCITQTRWPLRRILEKTNKSVAKNNYSCMFATLFCGILNINSGLVQYASAAHEFPFICRNKKNILEEINISKSTFIGAVADNIKIASGYFTLRPGDLLFLYTDGIIDAKDKNGNFFRKERLKQLLNKNPNKSPEEIVDIIKKEISDFAEGTPQNDDITILALKYK